MASNEVFGYGLLILVAVAVIVTIPFLGKIKQAWLERRLSTTVRKLGCKSLQNVILPDGMDGTVCIDNLVLLPDRILVVEVGRYQGAVFASDNIDIWTQVLGKRSYKFANPLLKLEQDIAAVRAHCPKIRISGILVYSAGVDFPKGKPDNVISLGEAVERFGNRQGQDVPAELQQAWQTLQAVMTSGE